MEPPDDPHDQQRRRNGGQHGTLVCPPPLGLGRVRFREHAQETLPNVGSPALARDLRDTPQGFRVYRLRERDLNARGQLGVARLELAHKREKLVRPRARDLVRRLLYGGGDFGANLAPVHGFPPTRT
jgi:hypothetical protein